MIDDINVVLCILISGIEDYACFYEILWNLNRFECLTDEEKLARSIKNLSSLLRKDFIALYWSNENTELLTSIINKEEALNLIQQLKFWQQPFEENWIRYETISRGKKLFKRLLRKREDVFADLAEIFK